MNVRVNRIRTDRKSCPSAHSTLNKIGRLVWAIVWLSLFRPTPRLLFAWRRSLLRIFGADIGRHARIDPTVRIWAPWNLKVGNESCIGPYVDCYSVDRIEIADYVTISQYAFLCTGSHDVNSPNMKFFSAPISIEDQAWICAGVFLSPGTTLHVGAVAGARSVVTKDVACWTIVAGNPAKRIRDREIIADKAIEAPAA